MPAKSFVDRARPDAAARPLSPVRSAGTRRSDRCSPGQSPWPRIPLRRAQRCGPLAAAAGVRRVRDRLCPTRCGGARPRAALRFTFAAGGRRYTLLSGMAKGSGHGALNLRPLPHALGQVTAPTLNDLADNLGIDGFRATRQGILAIGRRRALSSWIRRPIRRGQAPFRCRRTPPLSGSASSARKPIRMPLSTGSPVRTTR